MQNSVPTRAQRRWAPPEFLAPTLPAKS
jgi:hypothetical protein